MHKIFCCAENAFAQTRPPVQLCKAPPTMIQEQESFFEEPFLADPDTCYVPASDTNRSRLDARRRLEQLQEMKRLRMDIGANYLEEL